MATARPAAQGARPDPALTPQPLVLLGGGEHAAVIADAARTRTDVWRLAGFVDPRPASEAGERLRLTHLGGDDVLTDGALGDAWLILAFGSISRRVALVGRLGVEQRWATVVHNAAWVSPDAELGPGVAVLAGAVVNHGARVGAHAIVNSGAVVEHDVRLGAHAHLAPGVVVGGGARIGSRAFVGLGALIRDHVVVGDQAVIGMGAVVRSDVGAGDTVVGEPARPRR